MKSLNVVLSKFFKESGMDSALDRYSILRDWQEIVGERVANVTTPDRVTHGVLFVRVQSDAWRHELIFYKPEILRTIRQRLGEAAIKDIVWF